MRRFFLALLWFALLTSCPAPELRYFKFINESEVTLTKLILTTPKNEKVVHEKLEHKAEFTFEQLPLGKYNLKIQSPKFNGNYGFTLTAKVPNCTVTLNKFFEIEGLPLDNMQFASDAEYRELEQKIDTVLEESRRASVNAMYEYADMVSDYLPDDITVKYNGSSITNKEEFMAQVDNFGDFEITYKDDATEAEINNKFSVIMENYLANRPKPLQNMLALNGIEGATEDEEYIYYEGNAIFKLDFESAELIKYYCGIYGKRADKMGFALDSTPLWKNGYRYAFDKSYNDDEAGKNFFRKQLKKWLDVIDNANYTIDQIIEKCEVRTGSAQYNLWYLGMYYLCKISKKPKGNNNNAGLSGLPGRLPWQFIHLYGSNDSDAGTVLHEIGHNLGLMHEHQRWDVLDNIIYRESSIQWVRFKGKMSSMYDINSIMHYPEAEFRETGKQKYPCYDFYGNRSYNNGYLSEIDKMFISTLYNPDDSSKHYQSDVPILDRVYVKSRDGVNQGIYNASNFTSVNLASFSDDVSLFSQLQAMGLDIPSEMESDIFFLEKGALELPGYTNINNYYYEKTRKPEILKARFSFNVDGFKGSNGNFYNVNDKVYYIDGRKISDSDWVDIYIKKFFWQELSCGYDIKEQGDYSVINVPLKEAVNSVDLRVQPPRGSALNYQFQILRDDVTLKSLNAKIGTTQLSSFNKNELATQNEFNISYIYNTNGVDIELGLKNGQSATVDGITYNGGGLHYNLEKSREKDINVVVNCDWSGTAQSYVIHLICLDEDALPNFMKITSDKDSKLLYHIDNFVDFVGGRKIIDIYKADVNNSCILEIDLKVGQKLFYSYDNSSFGLMNSPIPVTLSENQTHLYLRLEYDNGFNTTVVPITLCFEKFDYYKLSLNAETGGLVKPEWSATPIKNGFIKDKLQTNKSYYIEVKAVSGFKPVIPNSFQKTNKQDLYQFQFDGDTTVNVGFEPLHESSFNEEIVMSPVTTDDEKIRCGTRIEASSSSISVNGNFIYLREPNTSYNVTIVKEEEKLGYLYKYQLWIGGDDPIIEIKGGSQNNGSLSKTFSGTQTFYRKLYALKGGKCSWEVGQPIEVTYKEPKF